MSEPPAEAPGIAVIGVGTIGNHHARNIADMNGRARLLAVADVDLTRAQHVANGLGVDAYADAESVLRRADIHGVVIATAVESHADLIRMAAEGGKHILCEKPLAASAAKAREASAAAAAAGVGLQVGFMRRCDPAYSDAFKAISRGDIGRPTFFSSLSRNPVPPARRYFTSAAAGNLFIESAGHDFDLARWLMQDEVVAVQAAGAIVVDHDLSDVQPMDLGLVSLKFENGAMGTVQNFKHAAYGYDIRTEIVGEDGAIFIGVSPFGTIAIVKPGGGDNPLPDHWLGRFEEAYVREMDDWVDSVRYGREPSVGAEDGVRGLAISEAAEHSRVTGNWVDVDVAV